MVRGRAPDEGSLMWARRLLDAGQRLAPDGSQYNVLRLHRVWAMQSAAADRGARLTLERMLDEFVSLTLRSAFFEAVTKPAGGKGGGKGGGGKGGGKSGGSTGEDDDGGEVVLRGRSVVLRYLLEKGFAQLARLGPDGKVREGGGQFVQPVMLTADGQTRIVINAGPREACGSSADRMRVGEQIGWSPWGRVLSIVRVEKPLPTHYECARRRADRPPILIRVARTPER
jgi:hypothetical protein